MTGAMFLLSLRTMARKISGSKLAIDRVNPTQGPQKTPATKAERTILTSSHIFRVTDTSVQCIIAL